MRSNFSSIITLVLFACLVYAGYWAGFWTVMYSWDMRTWTIFVLGILGAWIARNEFPEGK